MTKIIKTNESKNFYSVNSNGRIDVRQLFKIELGEMGQGYDNLQFHEKDYADPSDFDEGDIRAEILFREVEDGGALLYDANSDDYEIFTADELKNGVESIYVGTSEFKVVEE